jgi:hypothetical protein
MTCLRFAPKDYRALSRFCVPLPTARADLAAFRRFLVESLADARPQLAERIAGLDGHKMGILLDHFSDRAAADAKRGGRHAFNGEELRVVAEACASYLRPVRFVRYLRMSLVGHLSDLFPHLARKVARLSERQFERLYERVTGRSGGSA